MPKIAMPFDTNVNENCQTEINLYTLTFIIKIRNDEVCYEM